MAGAVIDGNSGYNIIYLAISCMDSFMQCWDNRDSCLWYMNKNKAWDIFNNDVLILKLTQYGYKYDEVINSIGQFLPDDEKKKLINKQLKRCLIGLTNGNNGVDKEIIKNKGEYVIGELINKQFTSRGLAMKIWYNSECKRVLLEGKSKIMVPVNMCYKNVLYDIKYLCKL